MTTLTSHILTLLIFLPVAGAILVALDASKELTTTLMLLPLNGSTLSSQLWATTNGESLDFTAAAPYAALLVALGVVPVFFLVRHTLAQLAPVRPAGTAAPDVDARTPADALSLPTVA